MTQLKKAQNCSIRIIIRKSVRLISAVSAGGFREKLTEADRCEKLYSYSYEMSTTEMQARTTPANWTILILSLRKIIASARLTTG